MTAEDMLSCREARVRRSSELRGLRGGPFIDQTTRLRVCNALSVSHATTILTMTATPAGLVIRLERESSSV